MLILTRKENQRVYFIQNDNIISAISIIEINSKQAKLGIEAGKNILILREELIQRDPKLVHLHEQLSSSIL
jgi:carbon storage regulator CsrA